MSDHDSGNGGKGGIRPPDYVYEMAIGRTYDLMIQGFSPRDVAAKLISEGYTDSLATVGEWRKEVHRRWAIEDAEERPARKDTWRARLEGLYRELLEKARGSKAETAAAILYAEAIKVSKLAIILDGLTAPVKVEHSGRVDVAAMAPHEREREIAELLRKRDEALKGKPTTKREPGLLS